MSPNVVRIIVQAAAEVAGIFIVEWIKRKEEAE